MAFALWSAAASALPSYFPSVLITWPLASLASARRTTGEPLLATALVTIVTSSPGFNGSHACSGERHSVSLLRAEKRAVMMQVTSLSAIWRCTSVWWGILEANRWQIVRGIAQGLTSA